MDRDRPAAVRTDDDALAAAKAVTSEGMALFQQGRFAEAVARGEEAVRLLERSVPPDHPRLLGAQSNLGLYLCAAGDEARGEAVLRAAIATARASRPGSHELGQALHNLALMLRNKARWAEADEAYRDAIAVLRAQDGGAVAVTLRDYGLMLARAGRADAARQQFAAAMDEARARLPPTSAAGLLQQLEQDIATADAAATGARAPAGDANGLVRESRMLR